MKLRHPLRMHLGVGETIENGGRDPIPGKPIVVQVVWPDAPRKHPDRPIWGFYRLNELRKVP